MIGNVPDEWRVEKLEKLSEILDGDRGKNYPKQEDFSDNDYCLFLNTKNVTKKGFNFNNTHFISKEKDTLLNKGRLKRNDLIITTRGTVGNIAFFSKDISYEVIRINSGMAIIRINTEDLSHSFLDKYLNSHIFSIFLSEIISGSAQPQITITKLKRLNIPIPPLPQQEKIVKVLDISSALIEKQKELIEKYDLFLKSKFIEMFGDPIGNPMGWEIEKLKEAIIDVKNGLTRRSNDTIGEVVLKLKDIRENHIRFENLNRINLDEIEKEKFVAEKDDLLFIRVNGNPDYVGRCSVFHGYTEAVYFNDHIMRIKVNKEKYNSVFLGYIVNSPYGKKQILKYRKTSAGQHTISQDGLERLSFYLPPIKLQNKFASIVEKIETIKDQENKKLEHLETLHNSLMDKAFKGEIQ